MSRGRMRVAVLMGGTSAEHDVSVCSGLNVLDALDPERFEGVPVTVGRDGLWRFGLRPAPPDLTQPPDPSPARDAPRSDGDATGERTRAAAAAAERPPATTPAAAGPGTFERLRAGEFDVVFVALHGPGGEDGTVQGLLELAGVAYTGSGVLASALAMDKVRSKRLVEAAGVPVARHELTRRGEGATAAADRLVSRVRVPCVVKPARGGSSFGTTVVDEPRQLPAALEAAWAQHEIALVEEFLLGREVTCGVLGGGAEPACALPVTEIVPVDGGFFDFRAKYTAGACREITPADLDEAVGRRVQELAVTAHEQIGCEGMSRSDFILVGDTPVYLETNTIPGMTTTSLLPQQAAADGIDLRALVSRLIDSALLRAGCSARGVLRGERR